MNKVITEDEDKKVEEIHVQHALENCGYPKWTFDKVKDKMAAPKQPRDTKRTTETPNRGFVVIPYVKGVSERVARVMKKISHIFCYETTLYPPQSVSTPESQTRPAEHDACHLRHPLQKL